MPACLMSSGSTAQAWSWPCSTCWLLDGSLMQLSRGARDLACHGSTESRLSGSAVWPGVQGLAPHHRRWPRLRRVAAAAGGHPSPTLLPGAAGARVSVSHRPCPSSTSSLSACSVWRLSPRSPPSTLWPTSGTTGEDCAWGAEGARSPLGGVQQSVAEPECLRAVTP